MRAGAWFRTATTMAGSRVPPSTALPCKTSWPMLGPARSPSWWSIKSTRLTRSLADFAKLVELFNQQGVSFVSITQSFNTTSSMGRLTLNVLLSFAQFEREVIGERVRDKIAASKRKGLWVGGPVPLGYRCLDKKLEIVREEAEVVRAIFS
jgi:site-specific DNA recombinase